MALHQEARLAVSGIRGHPFGITEAPEPTPGPLPPDFELPASVLVQTLASASLPAAILSPTDTIIVPRSNLPLAPSPPTLPPALPPQHTASPSHGTPSPSARHPHPNSH